MVSRGEEAGREEGGMIHSRVESSKCRPLDWRDSLSVCKEKLKQGIGCCHFNVF